MDAVIETPFEGRFELRSRWKPAPSRCIMNKLSGEAWDKLQAALNTRWTQSNRSLPPSYLLACRAWLEELRPSDHKIVAMAVTAYSRGDEDGAKAIAAALPPAPVFPG